MKKIVFFLIIGCLILSCNNILSIGTDNFSTIQEYVFPIGKTKPAIELPEVKMQ